MTCTTPCWAHTYNQGRGCLCDTNASRAALGLAPLHTQDGGHTVSGPLVFPIEREEPTKREEDDTPVITPESAESFWKAAQGVLAFIAIAALAIACAALRSKGAL